MGPYKTPDVYVEEISTFPPSVAEVSTAIPVFIGRTEKAGKDWKYRNMPVRITTFLEYKNVFGYAEPAEFSVTLDKGTITDVTTETAPSHLMYHSLDHFFKNGGGACYIVSIGGYGEDLPTGKTEKDLFNDAVDIVAKEDEPTLFVLADALRMANADYFSVIQNALEQCNLLKDRFVIVDKRDADTSKVFRDAMNSDYLKYGAAYTPYLETSLTHTFDEKMVAVSGTLADPVQVASYTADGALKIEFNGTESKKLYTRINISEYEVGNGLEFVLAEYENDIELKICGVGANGKPASELLTEWELPAYDNIRAKGWHVSVIAGQ
ncbi:MAG: hypothetical protein AAF570_23115, partial [Bacteroidota bacterium]